jgi:hypothetical protein
MGIDIKIQIDLSARQKKIVRVAVVTGAVIGALGIGIAFAAPISTSWSMDGLTLKGADLKGALDGLQTQITQAQTDIAALQAKRPTLTVGQQSYSLDAKYCGSTTGAYDGAQVSGYDGARTKCQSTAGCGATAHMCAPDELLRSAALGVALPVVGGWVGSFIRGSAGTGVETVSWDCQGFTSNAATYGGFPQFGSASSGKGPQQVACTAAVPIVCCD